MAIRPAAATILSLVALVLLAVTQYVAYGRTGWNLGLIAGMGLMFVALVLSLRARG